MVAEMKKLILLLSVVASAPVIAAETVVQWINPTENTDGTAIPADGPNALSRIRVDFGTCSGSSFGTKKGEVFVSAPGTSTTLTLDPGKWCIRALAQNNGGQWSASSNVISRVVESPVGKPKPPVVQ